MDNYFWHLWWLCLALTDLTVTWNVYNSQRDDWGEAAAVKVCEDRNKRFVVVCVFCLCACVKLRYNTQQKEKRSLSCLCSTGCQCLTGACDWLLLYVPLLTLPPVWLGRSAVVTRKQGRSLSLGLKISSGDMAWSIWGQSSLARAALAASPFSLESFSQTIKNKKERKTQKCGFIHMMSFQKNYLFNIAATSMLYNLSAHRN